MQATVCQPKHKCLNIVQKSNYDSMCQKLKKKYSKTYPKGEVKVWAINSNKNGLTKTKRDYNI